MSAGHSHATVRAGHERKLWLALGLTGSFMIAEVIGAFVTGSLALLSDAAHMMTDTLALAISLVAIQVAKRAADRKRTFGYARFKSSRPRSMRCCCSWWRSTSSMRLTSVCGRRPKSSPPACW